MAITHKMDLNQVKVLRQVQQKFKGFLGFHWIKSSRPQLLRTFLRTSNELQRAFVCGTLGLAWRLISINFDLILSTPLDRKTFWERAGNFPLGSAEAVGFCCVIALFDPISKRLWKRLQLIDFLRLPKEFGKLKKKWKKLLFAFQEHFTKFSQRTFHDNAMGWTNTPEHSKLLKQSRKEFCGNQTRQLLT